MARATPAEMQKAKEARQKKIAIVGGVLFLAIAGIQVPRTMKLLNGGDEVVAAPPPVTTAPAPTAGGGLALPPVAGGSDATRPAGGASAGATADAGPVAVAGQLVSFTRFASKDPFVQQINASATAPDTAGGGGTGEGESGGATGPGSAPAEGGGTAGGGSSGGSTPDAPTSAQISLDGAKETVAVGGEFPKATPLFRLVKLTRDAAQIGIAGGSYASGEQTATLRRGTTLVLQNTADGTRYELRLVSVG